MAKIDKKHFHIGVLNAMIGHITKVISEVDERIQMQATGKGHPSEQSLSTLKKARGDMQAQSEALEFARDECVRAYGSPPQIIEQQRSPFGDIQ